MEYAFGALTEAMVKSPNWNGAPILSMLNVIETSGVRLLSRATFNRRTRVPKVVLECSWASARSSRTDFNCSANGRPGSSLARNGTVLTQCATRRGLSSFGWAARAMPTTKSDCPEMR